MPAQSAARRRALAAAAMSALLVSAAPLVAAAAPNSAPSISRSHSISTVATVKAVDVATRHVTITDAQGETTTVKAAPEFARLKDLKAGDKIKATYTVETDITLTPLGGTAPKDKAAAVVAHTVSGGPPGAVVAGHLTVTGAVLAIDTAKHTLKVVNPKGGEVHTIEVTEASGRAAMAKLKVGDKITAEVTESLLLTAIPAA